KCRGRPPWPSVQKPLVPGLPTMASVAVYRAISTAMVSSSTLRPRPAPQTQGVLLWTKHDLLMASWPYRSQIYARPPRPHGLRLRLTPVGCMQAVSREGWSHGSTASRADQPIPAPARRQSGRLVAVVRRGIRGSAGTGRTGNAVGWLLGMSLVPRHGA